MRKSKNYSKEEYEELLHLLQSGGYKRGNFLKNLEYNNNMIKDHVRLHYPPVVYNVMFIFSVEDMPNFYEDESPTNIIAEWRIFIER